MGRKRAQYQKEETYLIKRYVSQIRNEVDYRDLSYEEMEESKANLKGVRRNRRIDY